MDIQYGKSLDTAWLKKRLLREPKNMLREIRKRNALFRDKKGLCRVRKCYVCGGRKMNPVLKIYGALYVQCGCCTHVFLKHRLGEKQIEAFYRHDKFYASTYADPVSQRIRREQVAKPKIEYVSKFIRGRINGVRWLDVGAGSGEIVSLLRQMKAFPVGLELSDHSRRFACDYYGLHLLDMDIEDHEREAPEPYDVVSFFGVLEHLYDPRKALNVASRMLKPGGLIVAEVPNYDSFSTRIQSAFPSQVIRHAEPFGHMMLFTRQSLELLFCLNHLAPKGLWYFGMDMHELFFQLSLIDNSLGAPGIKRFLYDHLDQLQGLIDRACLSDTLLMVGRNRK